jgi:hypothetical protein
MRFGGMPLWIGGVVVLFVLRRVAPPTLVGVLSLVWIAYAFYSWVVPPLVRRRVMGRGA